MRIKNIIKGQSRSLFRDPLTAFLFFIPILIFLLVEFGLSFIQPYLEQWILFENYREFIHLLIYLICPTILGMVMGLVYLDEKDMDIFSFIEVTPVNIGGYLWIKNISGMIIGSLFNVVLVLLFKDKFSIQIITLILLSAILVPYYSMLMLISSKNRVEGLTKGKLLTFTIIGAVVPYFTEHPASWLFSLLPTFWMERVYTTDSVLIVVISLIFGFITGLGPIIYLIRKRKI